MVAAGEKGVRTRGWENGETKAKNVAMSSRHDTLVTEVKPSGHRTGEKQRGIYD